MLGLADRGQTIALFESVMGGKPGEALEGFRALWGFGADPAVVMLDLLDHCHGAAVAKALGPDALTLPKEQAARLAAIGAHTSAGTLSRLWQMLLKAHDEVRRAPDARAAAEMALIRLCYAADLPGPEEALKALRDGTPVGGGAPGGGSVGGGGSGGGASASAQVVSMAAPAAQAMPVLASFDDVLALIAAKRDIGLRLDVEQFVRPISFRPGAITYEAAPGAPGNLAGRLVRALKEWTGQPWLVAAEGGGGAETLMEREKREKNEALAQIKADPFVASLISAFPGLEIVDVRKLMVPETASRTENERCHPGRSAAKSRDRDKR
jgi:DNA polymerase-3 subunit gamma/tau